MTTTTATAPRPATAPDGAPANPNPLSQTARQTAPPCCPPEAADYTGRTRNRGGQLRDTQRGALYGWQWAHPRYHRTHGEYTHEEATALIHRICDDYGVPRIPVEDAGPRRIDAWFRWSREDKPGRVKMIDHYGRTFYCYIRLPDWAKNRYTAIHEAAHYITHQRYGLGATPGHGPEFAATLVELLARYTEEDEDEMRASMEATPRLKIAPRPACGHQDTTQDEGAPAPAPAEEDDTTDTTPDTPAPAPAPAPATTETTGGQLAWALPDTDNAPAPTENGGGARQTKPSLPGRPAEPATDKEGNAMNNEEPRRQAYEMGYEDGAAGRRFDPDRTQMSDTDLDRYRRMAALHREAAQDEDGPDGPHHEAADHLDHAADLYEQGDFKGGTAAYNRAGAIYEAIQKAQEAQAQAENAPEGCRRVDYPDGSGGYETPPPPGYRPPPDDYDWEADPEYREEAAVEADHRAEIAAEIAHRDTTPY